MRRFMRSFLFLSFQFNFLSFLHRCGALHCCTQVPQRWLSLLFILGGVFFNGASHKISKSENFNNFRGRCSGGPAVWLFLLPPLRHFSFFNRCGTCHFAAPAPRIYANSPAEQPKGFMRGLCGVYAEQFFGSLFFPEISTEI